jgi:hypothetical protein
MIQRLFATCLTAAALAIAAVPAQANQDAVSFGSDIHVAANSTVHDAVCFFCSVNDEGKVNGDIVVFFGDVHIAGQANHDVVNFFGSVDAENGTSIGNDLVNFFGSIQLGENVSVGRDLVSMFGSFEAASSVTNGGDRVIQPFWIAAFPLLLVVLFFVFAIRALRAWRWRQLYYRYPFPPYNAAAPASPPTRQPAPRS